MIVPAKKIVDPEYLRFAGAHESCPSTEILPVLGKEYLNEEYFIKSKWCGDDICLKSSVFGSLLRRTDFDEDIFDDKKQVECSGGLIGIVAMAFKFHELNKKEHNNVF